MVEPPNRHSARLASQNAAVGEGSVEGGVGGSADTSSACRASASEPPPPSHEHQALVGEAVHNSVPPALLPEVPLYRLPIYA